ncbi:MAG: hypothetical protein M1820_001987 [Bogoriella megaspora]|nr:MAG: hypothetical protein M1820_001987 [Bogoriella megaspora]
MAKSKTASHRSRAARRAVSPSINTDKSLKNVEVPVETAQFQANILSLRSGGIEKKKSKPLRRQKRLRQQKGAEKADRNFDKLDNKVAKSREKGKKVKARRGNWDDLNRAMTQQKGKDDFQKTGNHGDIDIIDAPIETKASEASETKLEEALNTKVDEISMDEGMPKIVNVVDQTAPIAAIKDIEEAADEIT